MTELDISGLTSVALIVFMFSAVVHDVRCCRIKNELVVAVLFLGIASQISSSGLIGIGLWVGGMAIGFASLLPFHLKGGMGAGDVKLMAAVGSMFGPSGAIAAVAATLIAGLPLALVVAVHRFVTARRLSLHATVAGHHVNSIDIRTVIREGGAQRFPYAAAIAVGATAGLWWTGRLQELAGAMLL